MARRSGFTLIELLVVIAIIALLVSILLPSLTKAKDHAKAVVCSSNIHGVSVGLLYYTEDNGGWFPYFANERPNGGWYSWLDRVGARPSKDDPIDRNGYFTIDHSKSHGAEVHCPLISQHPGPWRRDYFHFSMNERLYAKRYNGNWNKVRAPQRIENLNADTIVLTDAEVYRQGGRFYCSTSCNEHVLGDKNTSNWNTAAPWPVLEQAGSDLSNEIDGRFAAGKFNVGECWGHMGFVSVGRADTGVDRVTEWGHSSAAGRRMYRFTQRD